MMSVQSSDTSATNVTNVEESKEETKTNSSSQKYYFNANPSPLKEDPVEHSQKETPGDAEMTLYLQKEYGDKLNKIPPDVVPRFVRGYAHETDRKKATVERLNYYFECFEKFHFDTMLNDPWDAEKELLEAWPIYIYGTDIQGHPVLYDEVGRSTPARVEKSFGGDLEKLRKFRLRFMQRLAVRKEKLSKKHGVMIYKHVMVMDVSEASMSSLNKFKNLVQSVIAEEQHLFPETLYKLFIVNAPWSFRAIWAIVSNFVDPITYQKVSVLGGSYLDELTKTINKNEIPPQYGGTCQRSIVYGNDSEENEQSTTTTQNQSQEKTETIQNKQGQQQGEQLKEKEKNSEQQ